MIEKEVFIKDGKVISADDVYLDPRDATIETQAAEIERLREALAKVLLVKQHTMNPIYTIQQMQRIARAALGDEK